MNVFETVKRKIDLLMEKLDPEASRKEPGFTVNGRYTDPERFEPFGSWTHSFFLGMVGRMYECTGESRYLDYLKREKWNYWNHLVRKDARIDHDAGFVYILYAVMLYKLTGDDEMRIMALKAADEIGKRYQINCGVIMAFGSVYEDGSDRGIVHIIPDDMMNLCILMWAYGETKQTFYKDVFCRHIETAVQYLIREDFSVRHGYYFDRQTGKPICEVNHCGYSIGSHWARGTAWMIFGLTKALECTGDVDRYLPPLTGVAEKYLNLVGDRAVPDWDFRIPGEPDGKLDTSAAAITACAFDSMKSLGIESPFAERCREYSERAYQELIGYLADETAENLINRAQCGNLQAGSLWGDYFFVELMLRKIGDRITEIWI